MRPVGQDSAWNTDQTNQPSTPADLVNNYGVGGPMSFDNDTGRIDWTPNNRDVGLWNFVVTHNDAQNNGNDSTDTVTFQVNIANRQPTLPGRGRMGNEGISCGLA